MNTTRRSLPVSCCWFAVVVAVLSVGLRSSSSSLAAKTESPLSGTVSGVVTLDGTEPLPGARVTLIPAGSANRKHTTRRAVTVEGGRFSIGIPAGKYLLRVFKQDIGQKQIKVEVKEHETTQVTVSVKDDHKKREKKDEK
jgi:hypothetical protein